MLRTPPKNSQMSTIIDGTTKNLRSRTVSIDNKNSQQKPAKENTAKKETKTISPFDSKISALEKRIKLLESNKCTCSDNLRKEFHDLVISKQSQQPKSSTVNQHTTHDIIN